MPDIRIATLGSKPMSSGASIVEPNMATTCCAPMATFLGHERHSSGCTTAPGALSSTRRQRGKKESDMDTKEEVSEEAARECLLRRRSDLGRPGRAVAKCKTGRPWPATNICG